MIEWIAVFVIILLLLVIYCIAYNVNKKLDNIKIGKTIHITIGKEDKVNGKILGDILRGELDEYTSITSFRLLDEKEVEKLKEYMDTNHLKIAEGTYKLRQVDMFEDMFEKLEFAIDEN